MSSGVSGSAVSDGCRVPAQHHRKPTSPMPELAGGARAENGNGLRPPFSELAPPCGPPGLPDLAALPSLRFRPGLCMLPPYIDATLVYKRHTHSTPFLPHTVLSIVVTATPIGVE